MLHRLIRWMADPLGSARRRRARLMARPLPPEWLSALEKPAFYHALPTGDQKTLRGLMQLFRHSKSFEGCGGFELTEEVMALITAHACLLILRRLDPPYPSLKSILVYPEAYVAKYIDFSGPRTIREDEAAMLGTSWTSGTVILAWSAVEGGYRNARDGHNVALHEFAHQLDQENGPVDGAPGLLPGRPGAERRAAYRIWQTVMQQEYEALCTALEEGRKTFLDPYGATHPAEFFAVSTEFFFERPIVLRRQHPGLYQQLKLYYQQDPAKWNW
jgi:Mlc titration factor MtfA (ptsG expression regulator)